MSQTSCPLFSSLFLRPLSAGPAVNLYQSHQQNYNGYSMTSAPAQQSPSEEVGGAEMVARSLNRAFYTTSYHSHIDKYAGESVLS